MKHLHILVFATVGLSAACSAQQTPSPDVRFIVKAAQANQAEVQMSAWAKEHALSDEVRDFASKLVDAHTALADDLRAFAIEQRTAAFGELDPKDAAEIDREKTLEPNILDRAYMREVMKWKQREAEACRREVEAGKHQNLRYWAWQTLQKVEDQIKQGEDIERAIGMEVATRLIAPPGGTDK